MEKNFLLSVGAQKCGTTWLHEYLRHHPNANMGFAKEYHVLDGLFVPCCINARNKLTQQASEIIAAGTFPLAHEDNTFRLLDFHANLPHYFDYFDSLLEPAGIRLTGDITPSYSALPIQALRMAKEEFNARNIRVKVIFMMRDPVERCISAARMKLRNQGVTPTKEDEEALLRSLFDTEEFMVRTRYDITIDNIEKVFDKTDIRYFFYESFFTPESINALCAFLDIPVIEPNFDKLINSSRTGNVIGQEIKRDIFKHYKPVYDYISQKFSCENIERLWNYY